MEKSKRNKRLTKNKTRAKKNARYWKNRAVLMEADKEKRAEELSNRMRKQYRRAFYRLTDDINELYAEVLSNGGLDGLQATQLYNLNSYSKIRAHLADLVQDLSTELNFELESLLNYLSISTLKTNGAEFGVEFNRFSQWQAEEIAKQNWSGIKFSDRVWGNSNHFSSRVMEDIEKLIIDGKTPDQLKKQLMKDFNASFHEADRLIRTESSRVYNQAALQSYIDAGCTEVDFLAEADCCELCEPYSGKRYPINYAPFIPVHPNCRCTYLPVIETMS